MPADSSSCTTPGSARPTWKGSQLVFVDGANGSEYRRQPLSGALAAGAYRVVRVDAQNGSPDGIALYDTRFEGVIDALSYEGAIERAFIGPFAHTLVEGTALPASVADSNTVAGSLARIPNGSDTDDAATDWAFTRTAVLRGRRMCLRRVPSAAPSPACSRAPPRRP